MRILSVLAMTALLFISIAVGFWFFYVHGELAGKQGADRWYAEHPKVTKIENVVFTKEVTFLGSVQIERSNFQAPVRFRCVDPDVPADKPPNLGQDFFQKGEGEDRLTARLR